MKSSSSQLLPNLLHNTAATLKNVLAELPGERPAWLVVELHGSYPARTARRKLLEFPPDLAPQPPALEQLTAQIRELAAAPWLCGVLFKVRDLKVNLATAYAMRRQVQHLREAGKQTVMYLEALNLTSAYLASAADEVALPESAEVFISGLATEVTFMRDALARFGVSFDKLAIDEYKNAGDPLVRQEMSEAQREQYSALLESFQDTLLEEFATARKVTKETVKNWLDTGVASAEEAQQLGMVDRVLYEDELVTSAYRPLAVGTRFLPAFQTPLSSGRVAVISLLGAIVPGKSRRSPLPMPLLGGAQAGAETLQRAFRAAEADESTKAIVFYVDSGGGSALASDLIWREVVRIKAKKPIIAVMGALAASGGYYVLTHADRIIAAPSTLTGSIGVVGLKPVLEEFNAKYGFNPQAISLSPLALTFSSSHPFSKQERALVQRGMDHVYGLFTRRVAEGRKLSRKRVQGIGRGHIWSGNDALGLNLVDELGDVETGIQRAGELANLPTDAPVWNVAAPSKMLLPSTEDPTTLIRTLAPWRRERVLLLLPQQLKLVG
jgi:protease-4